MKIAALAVGLFAVLAHSYVVEEHLRTHDQFTLTGQFCYSTVKNQSSLFSLLLLHNTRTASATTTKTITMM